LRVGKDRCECRLVVRRPADPGEPDNGNVCVVDTYDDLPADCFQGIDVVVNCVGRTTPDPSGASLTHVNVDIPVAAARSAMRMNVRHFIQASSLSIFGHVHRIDRSTPVAPTSDYGRSKQLAEERLRVLADQGLRLAIVRLPMLYGSDIEGKLSRLARLMVKLRRFPVPPDLPRRSTLHIDNAATTVLALAESRSAGTFFAADARPFDLQAMATAIQSERGERVSLIRFPGWVFRVVRLVAPGVYASLYEPSVVDVDASSYPLVQLPVTLEDGLRTLVRHLPG
jgi:UDP-glucose 4-epimerase